MADEEEEHLWIEEQPLVTHIFTADPSAHVFNGKIYIYPSHDIETSIEDNDNGTFSAFYLSYRSHY